jgi:hypothetical protein
MPFSCAAARPAATCVAYWRTLRTGQRPLGNRRTERVPFEELRDDLVRPDSGTGDERHQEALIIQEAGSNICHAPERFCSCL